MLVALSHGATSAPWGVASPHTVAAPLASDICVTAVKLLISNT